MKVLLFRGGKAGAVWKLPGKFPEPELEDLMGGAVAHVRISERLMLVTLADAEELQKPIDYAIHRIGRNLEPVAGDAAVIHVERTTGRIRDITPEDVERAKEIILLTEMEK